MHPDLESPPSYDGVFLPGIKQVRELATAFAVFAGGLRAAVKQPAEVDQANRKKRRARREQMRADLGDGEYWALANDEEADDEQLAWAEVRARFAKEQLARGAPYLYNLGVIRLWGILEATVDDAAIELIETRPKVMESKALEKLNVPLVSFSSAGPRERARVIAQAVKDSVGATKRNGVERFESLLAAIGLKGPYDDAVKKSARELSALRHVLVHRDGVVDARFREQCSWLQLKDGDRIEVDSPRFSRFGQTAEWLLLEYERRLQAFDGMREDSERLRTQIILAGLHVGKFTTAKNWPPAKADETERSDTSPAH